MSAMSCGNGICAQTVGYTVIIWWVDLKVLRGNYAIHAISRYFSFGEYLMIAYSGSIAEAFRLTRCPSGLRVKGFGYPEP